MNAAPTGTLVHLNPADIATDKNIRTDLQLTPEWIKNLKQHGVQTPISAYWDPVLEHYQVEKGHRRTVGAVEAGLPTIPVYVIDKPTDDADRITDQLIENIQRAALHDTEEAGAYRQLAFAMPAMQIAKRTNAKFARIGDSLKVTASPAATKALAEYQLTVEDALVFAEFNDDEQALAELNETATTRPERLAHTAQQIRDARSREAERQAVIADLTERGIPILEKSPPHDDRHNLRVTSLYTDDTRSKRLQLEDVPADHLAAIPELDWEWSEDKQRQVQAYVATYIVTDYPTLGYVTYASSTPKGPLTDDEKTQRAQSRVNSKLWVSATTVRIAWVKELLQRRSLPKDAAALAALWAAKLDHAPNRASAVLSDLLGVKQRYAYQSLNDFQLFAVASPDQGLHVVLAVAIACIEGTLDEKKGWEGGYTGLLPYYLKQLAAWSYPLSEIEESIVKAHDVAQAKAAKKASAA